MIDVLPLAQRLTRTLVDHFAALPQVAAVALGGSHSRGTADETSDIDLYVYTHADIALPDRQAIVTAAGGASRADLGLTFWGPGDEWFDAATGIEVDIVYVAVPWIEAHLHQVIHEHRAALGYTTCFWRTVRHSYIWYDSQRWFQNLQHHTHQPYPEALRHNIIALNYPVLRQVIPSYVHQLEKAVQRQDKVSINHRTAALLASYFDVLFALNRSLHPGEKRLVAYAQRECTLLPHDMAEDVDTLLTTAGTADQQVVAAANTLLDHLDDLLAQEGVIVPR